MSKQHTPTPWIADDFPKEILIRAEDGSFIMAMRKSLYPSEKIANANIIVKAVNNHDKLVEALESIVITINSHTYPLGQKGVKVIEEAKQLLTELKS